MRIRTPLLFDLWRREFSGYSRARFGRDLVVGLTVAAVALPLALAFGVASGSTAAAGLVTAILASLIIGALSGAPYQISGPTGAMSAVMILVVQQHGLRGLWLASLLAAAIVLALGIFRLGRIINFIPAPVITGFTSGLSLVIAIGQIDNALGITTAGAHSSALKLLGYVTTPLPAINGYAVACTLGVIVTMLALPRCSASQSSRCSRGCSVGRSSRSARAPRPWSCPIAICRHGVISPSCPSSSARRSRSLLSARSRACWLGLLPGGWSARSWRSTRSWSRRGSGI